MQAVTTALSCLVLSVSLALSACGSASSEPGYNVLPRGELHTKMWTLLDLSDELNQSMRVAESGGAVSATQVRDILHRMQQTAQALSAEEMRSAHPLMVDNIDFFRDDLQRALQTASNEPPNYFLAGKVTAGCIYRHDPKGGLRTR